MAQSLVTFVHNPHFYLFWPLKAASAVGVSAISHRHFLMDSPYVKLGMI